MRKLLTLIRSDQSDYRIIVLATRLISSFIGAFVFNILWLIFFISFGKLPRGIVGGVLWCAAPLIIACGYSYGIIVYDFVVLRIRKSLLSILPWPLIGCAIGEVVALSSGPMVMGLSIFILGGVAMLLREIKLLRQNEAGKPTHSQRGSK
jgi:hypothetical protein